MKTNHRTCNLGYSCGGFMEELEPRLLMSTTWTGTYSDGTPLKVTLSGMGTLAVTGGANSAIDTITVGGAGAKDVLTISGKPAGGGLIEVNRIDVSGPLKAIKAPKVDLLGDAADQGIVTDGWVGSVSLNSAGADIRIGQPGVPLALPITVNISHSLFNSDVVLSSPISSFKAHEATGSVSSESYIKSIKVVGAFIANVTSAGTIGSITAGDVGGGTWQAQGDIGTVKMATAAVSLHVITPANIKSVTVAGNASFDEISATTLGSLTVGGNLQMQNAVTLAGTGPDAICLKTFKVGGWWSTGALRAHGSVGTVQAGGLGDAKIFAGVRDDYANYTGDDTAANTLETVGGALSTATINKVIVTGKAHEPDNPGYLYSVKTPNISASSLPYVRLAHADFSLAPDHAISARNLGTVTATGIDGAFHAYRTNWTPGHLLVVTLL